MQKFNQVDSLEGKQYNKSKYYYLLILILGVLSLFCIVLLSLCLGNYKTTLEDIINTIIYPAKHKQIYNIITLSRLPRLIGSLFVGAALSVAGLVYQDIFCNKMASPDLLGVSAGAGCGASCAILLGFSFSLVSVFAFIGGIIAVFLTMIISTLFGKSSNKSIALILSGIVVGGLMNSILGLCKYLSSDTQLSSITFWLLGGFDSVTYVQLAVVIPIIFVSLIILLLLRWKILLLKNGDVDAKMHGINASVLRYCVIILSTIITASAVCLSGTIGWVGLAIPNLMRLFVNNDNKRLMPISIIYGMLFMSICDLLARTLTKSEIPVGILTGVLGAILFVIVLIIKRTKHGKCCY